MKSKIFGSIPVCQLHAYGSWDWILCLFVFGCRMRSHTCVQADVLDLKKGRFLKWKENKRRLFLLMYLNSRELSSSYLLKTEFDPGTCRLLGWIHMSDQLFFKIELDCWIGFTCISQKVSCFFFNHSTQ